MPSATDELSAKFPGGYYEARLVLANGGYRLTGDWEWIHPLAKKPTSREADAVTYLHYEWDYGGWSEIGEGR